MDHITNWDCKKIDDLHSMHFMASISHQDCTLLNVRNLACFCNECMDNNSKFYLGKEHVKPWRLN